MVLIFIFDIYKNEYSQVNVNNRDNFVSLTLCLTWNFLYLKCAKSLSFLKTHTISDISSNTYRANETAHI